MQPCVLSVGRLVPRKGHGYLIEAIRKLASEGMGIHLVIVGSGPEQQRLREMATGLNVDIKSDVTQQEIDQEYKNADVFVLPSVTDERGEKEGLGLVLLEAIAHSVPVIAFDSGGTKEVVKHGQTGILVPEKDVTGLAKAIRTVLENQDLRRQLTINALAFARATFSRQAIVQRQVAIYEEVLGESNCSVEQDKTAA